MIEQQESDDENEEIDEIGVMMKFGGRKRLRHRMPGVGQLKINRKIEKLTQNIFFMQKIHMFQLG